LPAGVFAADMITTPLRLIKDAAEVDGVKAAAKLTEDGLRTALEFMAPGVREEQLAAAFEFRVKYNGGELAFESIVAGGPNAAVLHHRAGTRKLKSDELVLFDIGARLAGLCGDLSRTVPVSGRFSPLQARHYDAVLAAQSAVLSFLRPGRNLLDINAHAEGALLDEALKLKILKGSRGKLLKAKAIKKYYPHSIGHSLGLDVHDPQRYPGLKNLVLEPGMIFTVEPGLYFRERCGKFPASGVRIEDDVLITKTGYKFLTTFPREREELEALLCEGESP
jgi:Xaa-Pro aminopeptidase